MVIAHHLILTGYGQWLPNDPRGSTSKSVRAGKLDRLGPLHEGRKTVQPDRETLKNFYRDARTQLEYPTIWFDEQMRDAIAVGIHEAVQKFRYTCFACAVLSNHAHLVIRKHRDRAESMVENLHTATITQLRARQLVPIGHPVWCSNRFKQFLFNGDDVRRTVRYVHDNYGKEGLRPIQHPFVAAYRGEWESKAGQIGREAV